MLIPFLHARKNTGSQGAFLKTSNNGSQGSRFYITGYMTPVTYHMTAASSILNMKNENWFRGGIKMGLIMCLFKIVTRFLRHLSLEYVHPYFYAAEKNEAQLKKERVCCEGGELIKRIRLL
jgi:hypothetical protein